MTNYLLDTGMNKGWRVRTKARAGWWGGLTRVALGGEGAEDVWGAPALRTSGILVSPHHFSSRFNADSMCSNHIYYFYHYYLVLQ